LLQEASAQLLFLVLSLLTKTFRLGGGGASLVGFGGKGLLLRDGFGFRLLGFFFLTGGFLRGG
jgi:hypothetical protein